MENGPLTVEGDVRVEVYDGKDAPVDSNDMAFKLRRHDGIPQCLPRS